MPRRSDFIPVFSFFLLLSFFLYALFQTGFGRKLAGIGEVALSPMRHGIFSVYAAVQGNQTQQEKLEEEIVELRSQLANKNEQEKEIEALRDQFATTSINSRSLLPAKVVGLKAFLPGYTLPEQLIIDKGASDGIVKDSVVVYKNHLVGKVTTVRAHVSVIDLTYKKGFSVTATSDKEALGVVKGQGGGEMILDNVVLSDTLSEGDLILTKGSTDSDGEGVPPGLVIGEVTSVDKRASAIFQTARLKRPLDITRLSTIFILSSVK